MKKRLLVLSKVLFSLIFVFSLTNISNAASFTPDQIVKKLIDANILPISKVEEIRNIFENISETSTFTSVDKRDPSIALKAKAGSEISTSVITVENGKKFQISGSPNNLKGLKYGDRGFTASWNFGPILNGSCSNNKIKETGTWKFSCKANKIGSTDVYVEIYKDGKTYSSNRIRVNIIENKEEYKPKIDMVRGKAADDFELFFGESVGIEGKNLIYAGKDAEVFLNDETAIVTQYNENILYFTVPSHLKSGKYDLRVRTSAGWSNSVGVYAFESRSMPPIITMVRGKATDDFELNANLPTAISGENLVFSGKDTRVFIGNQEGRVTQYDKNVIYFDVPNMQSGDYTLYVQTSAGKSNVVNVKVNGKG